MRWYLRQSEYDFEETHRADLKQRVHDESSGLQTTGKVQSNLNDDLHFPAINERESGELNIPVETIHDNEKIMLSATEEQVDETSLTEIELVIDQKRDKYYHVAAFNV